MREGRERGTDDENPVPQKHKRRSIGKKCLLRIENSKNTTFFNKIGANCETVKTAISGLIEAT